MEVYLSKKPGKVDIPELKIVPFPKGYYFDLDKGHLLAKEFMQYIGSNIEELRPFFYKNKRSNLFINLKMLIVMVMVSMGNLFLKRE